jgi:hypothetical protein
MMFKKKIFICTVHFNKIVYKNLGLDPDRIRVQKIPDSVKTANSDNSL